MFSPNRQSYSTANTTTLRTVLSRLPTQTLKDALRASTIQGRDGKADPDKHQAKQDPTETPEARMGSAIYEVGVDGKGIRGTSEQTTSGGSILITLCRPDSLLYCTGLGGVAVPVGNSLRGRRICWFAYSSLVSGGKTC